jgi:hypothetical protein
MVHLWSNFVGVPILLLFLIMPGSSCIINFLRTEREVFCTKRLSPIFLCTYRVSEVNKKIISMPFIGIYTWKQEMHDFRLVAWYTFGQRKQKIPMYSFFSTKNHSQISFNNKLNYHFQIFN